MNSIMGDLVNHLWQSTVFAAGVAALAVLFRRNAPRARYRLWLAASVKFLVPFSLLVSAGRRVEIPPVAPIVHATTVEQITLSFAPATASLPRPAAHPSPWLAALAAVWLAGTLFVLGRWFLRWLRIRRAVREAVPLALDAPVPVLSSATALEPGVFGLFRPVLLLPDGIASRLGDEEFRAILAHEMCHVREWDNLTAAVHMLVEALFWFHPAVWWIGARLVSERERACDQSVLAQGSHPQVYAQGILNVCKLYLESPLPCTSGVTGADLKQRIREIMARRVPIRLTLTRKLLLVAAGAGAVSVPVVIGLLRAQTLPPPPAYSYDVVSIRPGDPSRQMTRIGPGPQGGIKTEGTTTMQLLTFAYDVREYQFTGGPSWLRSDRYDVSFTPDKAEPSPKPGMGRDALEGMFNRQRQRMQAVLRDRFGLVLRAETREMPTYALLQAKGGHKLSPHGESGGPHMMMNRGQMTANGVYLNMLTNSLSSLLGRYVSNDTGLDGPFDFKLQFAVDSSIQLPGPPGRPDEPPPPGDSGVSIFTALTEQLGLRLESRKGPVPVFVIEKIEKPSEN